MDSSGGRCSCRSISRHLSTVSSSLSTTAQVGLRLLRTTTDVFVEPIYAFCKDMNIKHKNETLGIDERMEKMF